MTAAEGISRLRSAKGSTRPLLTAIATAWAHAEEVHVGDSEANRWSPVCKAALELLDSTP